MSAESVGSCVGSPAKFSGSRSPFREEKNLFSPNTPDQPRRRKSVTCFRCNAEGHYAPHCPLNAKRAPAGSSPPSNHAPKFPPTHYPDLPCKFCRRPCVVRTSASAANPGRDYYKCLGSACTKMFQWCDEVGKVWPHGANNPMEPVMHRSADVPQIPECPCTAGPCRVETKQSGRHKGRKYFACPLKMGQGACVYKSWCDGLGDDVELEEGLNHNLLTEEPKNGGIYPRGAIEAKGKGVIISKDIVVPTVTPPLTPTTPRADHKESYVALGSSPSKRPNLLEDSPSKRMRIEEGMNDSVASPSLDCYLIERRNNAGTKKGGPVLLSPPQPGRGRFSDSSWLVRSPMRRLNLNEDDATEPKKCVLCEEAGHEVNECPLVEELTA